MFHCIAFACVNHQLSRHEPAQDGVVRGVVYRNKIGCTVQKTFQNNLPQEGAPPQLSVIVRVSLNQHGPHRWNGCAGPISWPTRSPDITPCEFFLWVYVQDCEYQTPVADITDPRNRAEAAIATADVGMLQCT